MSDVDLDGGGLEVRRSRHLYEDSATKTKRAQRHVELLPETVRILAAIQPVRVLGIRSRGIFSCKDTYLSTVLPLKPIPWIEEQTGVIYATLKKHYAKWLPRRTDDAASRALGETCRGGESNP